MPADAIFFGMLHLLVFAYWLGGDIGVFYSSFLLTDEKRAAAGRLAAGKILSDVDLVPRFALIMTAPTGLALADAKGWISLDAAPIAAAFAAAFAWTALLWRLHKSHAELLRRLDLGVRAVFVAGLGVAAAGALWGAIDAPRFVAVKLIILAFCVVMGLCVRLALKPFGPAFAKLAAGANDAESDRALRLSLDRARPFVLMIWLALAAAAWLGLATPT
jgi:hypothetical protein